MSMENQSLGDCFLGRLNIAIRETGLSRTGFAKKAGISQGYLSDILKNNKSPSERVISQICLKHSLNEEWLVNGKGDMFSTSQQFKETEEIEELIDAYKAASDEIKEAAMAMLKRSAERSRNTGLKGSDCAKLNSA